MTVGRPPGVVVSRVLVQGGEADLVRAEFADHGDEVGQGTAVAVERRLGF